MENKSSINSTSANSTSQSTPDEIYIAENHPNAKNFVNVAGRCYQKTSDSSTTYSITTENVFSGLLKRGDVTVHNPHNDFANATVTRTDLVVDDFADCDACENLGDKFRGQNKENFRDFHIKVIKEVDDNLGDVVAYRLSGEDRKGKFTLHGNRHLEIYDKDSITFDTTSLGDEESLFVVSGGLSPDNSSKPNKTIVGKPRYDELLSTSPAHSVATLSVATHTYSGGSGLGGNIVVKANPFNENPEYNDTKLKQFPDRLHNSANSSFVIKNDGKVLVAGENDEYQLAKGRTNRKFNELHENIKNWQESEINEIGQIKKIVGHSKTIGFLTYDNKFYVAGRNDTYGGNLGQGSTSAGKSFTPKQILIDHADKAEVDIKLSSDIHTQIVDADIGRYHGIALDVNQRIWFWGNPQVHGSSFFSGNNSKAHSSYAVPTTVVISSNGGQNYYGETVYRGRFSNYLVANTHNTLLLNDGQENIMPEYVGKIIDIKCGSSTSYLLNEYGQLFSAGFNGYGALGQGHLEYYNDFGVANSIHESFGRVFSFNGLKDVRVKRVIPGRHHCFAILENNSLYGWGRNDNYQLGLSEENTIDGIHRDHYVTPILIDTDVDDVFAGEYNSAVKKLDGSIYAMGYNKTGVIAMFGDGRALGLDRHNSTDGVVSATDYAKVPTPWFEASDGIVEVAFGKYHSIIKQIDRSSGVKIKYYSAGNNTQGERGVNGLNAGGTLGEWNTSYDNKTDTYAGSDRWTLIHTETVS